MITQCNLHSFLCNYDSDNLNMTNLKLLHLKWGGHILIYQSLIAESNKKKEIILFILSILFWQKKKRALCGILYLNPESDNSTHEQLQMHNLPL